MKTSEKGIELIKSFEGLRLKAYKCSAGVDTIGYGATFYPSGEPVQAGDSLKSEQDAILLLKSTLEKFEQYVVILLAGTKVNQNQFDALVSFTYNVGRAALAKSTMIKIIRANPNDLRISSEFMKWVNAGGKKLQGLERRRQLECKLYFNKET